MFSLPTVFVSAIAFVSDKYAKFVIENEVADGKIPKDAMIARNDGLVVGVVNGGVYKPFPV